MSKSDWRPRQTFWWSCSDWRPRQTLCQCWNQTGDQGKHYANVEIRLGTKANIMSMLKSDWGPRQTLCQCWNQTGDYVNVEIRLGINRGKHGHVEIQLRGPRLLKSDVGPRQTLQWCPNQTGDQGKHSDGPVQTGEQGKDDANVEIRLGTKPNIMPMLKSVWGLRQTLCQCWNQTGD